MSGKFIAASCAVCLMSMFVGSSRVLAQMGRRLPAEKKIVTDPVTGVPLEFLTDDNTSNAKIYQTHQQWTSDGKWVTFRGNRPGSAGEAMAVNEATGEIVQITEGGYIGMLCNAHHSNKLYIMTGGGNGGGRGRGAGAGGATRGTDGAAPAATTPQVSAPAIGNAQRIVEIDLDRVFADSAAGTMKPAAQYERVCGTVPAGLRSGGNMGLDANDDFMYFNVTGPETAQLSSGQTLQQPYGPRNMGAGPSGLRSMNLKTGEVKMICNVGFQIGHVQTNPVQPKEIIFCWETGGKAPQRTWFVNADGSGLRPLYPEASYDWITHEAAFDKDEVAIAILAHRNPGANDAWGNSSTGEHPSGVGIVNLRTKEMRIVGQVPLGNVGKSIWHVAGSLDGRWAAADDFQYRLWLIDRHNGEMIMLADLGHKTTAADHIHPTFSLDSNRIEVQTAMISPDNHNLDICVVPVPKTWLARTYSLKVPE
jgi:oligogalacturonide lyase